MSSLHSQISRLVLLAGLLLAAGCETTGGPLPPAADLAAVTEKKPQPTDDIATSQKAADDFSASIEGWGDRLYSGGGRLCRWFERTYKKSFKCPKD